MIGYRFLDSGAIPWRKSRFADGVEVKDLGAIDGRAMQLVRYAPGMSFPAHEQLGAEFIYLVEGEALQEGQRIRPGWAAVAATGTRDGDFHSRTGCVFLTVYSE